MSPETAVTRREALEDAAYAELEASGAFAADREEAVLSAIYQAALGLAETLGADADELERRACDLESNRPLRRAEPSKEERERLDEEETRRGFAQLLSLARSVKNRS